VIKMVYCVRCGCELYDEEDMFEDGSGMVYCRECENDAREWERANWELDDMKTNRDYYF